ncbi:MAG: nucleoside kinase [Bacteroidaceae bacterium]|nr:nucleoside kinase [Bacteroidaceae bacterium]
MIQIRCHNNGVTREFTPGLTLQEIYDELALDMPYGAVSARVNNKVEGLAFKVYNSKDVEYLDITSDSGMRTYVRTLFFVLSKAVSELYPEGEIIIEHPVSKGYFCNLRIGRPVAQTDVDSIKQSMQDIIAADIPIRRIYCPTENAIEAFRREGRMDVAMLLETTGKLYSTYYQLGDKIDYYYGSLLTSTGKIHLFELQQYHDGLLLRVPSRENPDILEELVRQDKMLGVFSEHHHWQEILGVSTVGDFNTACRAGHATELINVSEALQEKCIVGIADDIHRRGARIVLIAGPSSSGKTTFSKRLSIQLMTNGLRPVALSLDDYFVDRELTPRDEHGEYDFESLYAIDLPYFNAQLNALLQGEEVELPRFDFTTGKRVLTGKHLQISDNTVLILEGIHALNPELTDHIAEDAKYKVYVSALTSIMLDDHNYIPTTDNRLLRRILRDYKYRGYSAEATISRWPSVRKGEEKWIFPFQEHADAMFNSALLFELAILKGYLMPILEQVKENCPEYSEAYRLHKFLQYFESIPDNDLPPTSLLREFLGGSSFKY